MVRARRLWFRSPMRPFAFINFFKLSNPSSRTMALASTEIIRNKCQESSWRCKVRPARKTKNFTADCLDNLGPRHLINLRASTVCYKDNVASFCF
jgi:hypothetical protein